jgi:hypothetical protein
MTIDVRDGIQDILELGDRLEVNAVDSYHNYQQPTHLKPKTVTIKIDLSPKLAYDLLAELMHPDFLVCKRAVPEEDIS